MAYSYLGWLQANLTYFGPEIALHYHLRRSLLSTDIRTVFYLYWLNFNNINVFIAINVLSLKRSKVLGFDLAGEGNLPCITIIKPVQRTKLGQPVLQFKRLLVDKRQILPLVIKNMSNVTAQVRLSYESFKHCNF